MTITEFLLARIAEDEASIEDLIRSGDHSWWGWKRYEAEREAKRRIVEAAEKFGTREPTADKRYGGVAWQSGMIAFELTLRALASVYADHPDYDPEWTPRA